VKVFAREKQGGAKEAARQRKKKVEWGAEKTMMMHASDDDKQSLRSAIIGGTLTLTAVFDEMVQSIIATVAVSMLTPPPP
jgi:hypothetical protein